MKVEKVLVGMLAGLTVTTITAILFNALRRNKIIVIKNEQEELAAQVNQLIINITKRFENMKEEAARIAEN